MTFRLFYCLLNVLTGQWSVFHLCWHAVKNDLDVLKFTKILFFFLLKKLLIKPYRLPSCHKSIDVSGLITTETNMWWSFMLKFMFLLIYCQTLDLQINRNLWFLLGPCWILSAWQEKHACWNQHQAGIKSLEMNPNPY